MAEINTKHEWFRLTYNNAKSLFVYLILLLIISVVLTLLVVVDNAVLMDNITILNRSFLGAIATSLLGATIFYSRKLYKACINLDMTIPQNETDKFRQLGIVHYFVLRPLFAIGLAILTVLLIKSGIYVMTDNATIKENFVFIVMVICFFVGYSAGDFIDVLEVRGKKVVENIVNGNNL